MAASHTPCMEHRIEAELLLLDSAPLGALPFVESNEDDRMASIVPITTADQLLQAEGLGRCELIRGALTMMTPAGFEHGRIVMRLGHRLESFVEPRGLGVVCGGDPGFIISRNPDTVRAPDIAFVRMSRAPRQTHRGYLEGPPDLAVEVLSPNDRPGEVRAKVQDWLTAGCEAVWVVDSQERVVSVYGPAGECQVLRSGDALNGGQLLPEFSLAVAEIFLQP